MKFIISLFYHKECQCMNYNITRRGVQAKSINYLNQFLKIYHLKQIKRKIYGRLAGMKQQMQDSLKTGNGAVDWATK